MEKIFNSLLFKVFCGIGLGILLGNYAPDWLYRILITFKSLFANFLNFSIPLIMIGLIMPSIGDLEKNAGKLLAITVVIAYGFTHLITRLFYFSTNLLLILFFVSVRQKYFLLDNQ